MTVVRNQLYAGDNGLVMNRGQEICCFKKAGFKVLC